MKKIHCLTACLLLPLALVGCESTGPYVGTHAHVVPHENILGQQMLTVRVDTVDAENQFIATLIEESDLLVEAHPQSLFVASTSLHGHHIFDALATYQPAGAAHTAFAIVRD